MAPRVLSGSSRVIPKQTAPVNEVKPPSSIKRDAFPFTMRSLLEMCWGMTLNLSHETQQQALGADFYEQFKQVFSDGEKDAVNGDFLRNLAMTLSAHARNIGFIRECHVDFLNYKGDRLSRRRQNIEQIADMASFSNSGLFSKLGSFLGFGSVAGLVTNGLNLSSIFIPIFAIGGIFGALLFTFGVGKYVDSKSDSWDDKIKAEQQKYWLTSYKDDLTNELYNLYLAIEKLIERFYPDKINDIKKTDDLLSMTVTGIIAAIHDEILPPDDLEWFPIIITSQSNTQSGSSQTPATQSKSKDDSTTKAKN